MKKFKVTFYTNVIYPTAESADSDQFTRIYDVGDHFTENGVAKLVATDLKVFDFLRDELSKTPWYYRTADVTSFTVREIEEEK